MEEMKIGFGEELHVQLEDCTPKRIEELEAALFHMSQIHPLPIGVCGECQRLESLIAEIMQRKQNG